MRPRTLPLTRFFAVSCVLAVAAGGIGFSRDRGRIDPADVLTDIRYLTSDELGGRGSGTPGLAAAAAYIAEEFRRAGLKPLTGDYLQPFQISAGAQAGAGNTLAYTLGEERAALEEADFLPFNFSGTGSASGQVVFAGYGISAPEYGYDDYADIDAKGKIVLVLRHEPQEFDEKSSFEGRVYTQHSQLLVKAENARAHGAKAVLFVVDTANHSGAETFEPFTALPSPGDAGIPYVQVKAQVVERWFQASGRSFIDVQQQIDRQLRPQSFALGPDLTVDVSVDIERTNVPIDNVVGYLPGRTGEYVIVGAHYDHLGTGEQYSLAPQMAGSIHPGADDNASGTAGVLAVARRLARAPQADRGVLFIAFAGEEIGLLGSTHYVNNPLLPLGDAVAMINMDMIGRMKEGRVMVGGASSGVGLKKVLEQAAKKFKISLDTDEKVVYGSSDHTAFKARSVPVLFFFTGLHSDYHRPSDTWDKIEQENTAELLELIAATTEQLRSQKQRPAFVRLKSESPHNGADTKRSNKFTHSRALTSR